MAKKEPLTVDFDSLLGPKTNLEQLAGSSAPIQEKTLHEKVAGGAARLMMGPKSKSRIAEKLAQKAKKVTSDFSHLTKNKRKVKSDSPITTAARELGLSEFWTKNR